MDTIPKIRTDLEILPLDTSSMSQKYLVVINGKKRLEISDHIYRLLMLIDGTRTVDEIAELYSLEINEEVTPDNLKKIIYHYLKKNGILDNDSTEDDPKKKKSILYFKISLFTSEKISILTNYLQYLFVKHVFITLFSFIVLSLLYFYFLYSGPEITLSSFTVADIFIIYILFFVTTLFHELGHASSCRYFGAKHGDIGVGLYLYFPVFYADVTDAWRLNRKQRTVVDLAGVYFQMLTIPIFFIVYKITGELVFIKVIYFLTFSLISTLNPFFRFDGYWLASDISGIPNLRKRSVEAVSLYFKKIFRRNNGRSSQILNVEKKSKIFFIIYVVISNSFFILFFYFLFKTFPDMMKKYPDQIMNFINNCNFFDSSFNIDILWKSFSAIVLPTLLIIMLLRILYSIFQKLMHFLTKSFKKKYLQNKIV
ncbi:MAG: hypothetical protein JW995_15750 [Melioribacteraceae bacterium]|nr:hypothetical protein [Melioribacteraceae bacterium]